MRGTDGNKNKRAMNINLTATDVRIVLDLLHDEILHEKQNYDVNPRNTSQIFIMQLENVKEKIAHLLKKDNK